MRTKKEFYRITCNEKSVRIPRYVIDFKARNIMETSSFNFKESQVLAKTQAKVFLKQLLAISDHTNLSDGVSTALLMECVKP